MKTSWCPICGQWVDSTVELVAARGVEQHRCRERTLRGIDATMPVEDRERADPSFGARLEEGFRMMADD